MFYYPTAFVDCGVGLLDLNVNGSNDMVRKYKNLMKSKS